MPLSKLLSTRSYDPESVQLMQTAFDGACRELEMLSAVNGHTYPVDRDELARVIMTIFDDGASDDANRLRRLAVDSIVARRGT